MHPDFKPDGGETMLREDIVVGGKFPDLALPDTAGNEVRLSEITRGRDPLAVVFYRGYW